MEGEFNVPVKLDEGLSTAVVTVVKVIDDRRATSQDIDTESACMHQRFSTGSAAQ